MSIPVETGFLWNLLRWNSSILSNPESWNRLLHWWPWSVASCGPPCYRGCQYYSLADENQQMSNTYLKVLSLFCHPLLSSRRIFTQRKIISSPPLKSIPSWTMSPSLTGNALLS